MDDDRRTLLAQLHGFTLEAAVDRLLELGVLDAATLSTRRDEQLRVWREQSAAQLGDELEALRRQARHQRRRAAEQIEESRRQRRLAHGHREAVVHLRDDLARQRPPAGALDAAHRALGAALAALALLEDGEEGDLAGLTIEPQRFGHRLVLRLEGEIDICTAPRLDDALAAAVDAGVDEVWVDLVGVRFMDSNGVAALLRTAHALPGPRRLAIICPDGPARRALEICGLGQLLPLHPAGPAR
jgi:anti-anti-sigma factor